MATASSSSSSTRHDPYKEFELYLEKANEEIGAVFHRLEAAASSSRRHSRTATAPPAPPARHAALTKTQSLNSSPPSPPSPPLPVASRRPGLRITDAHYVGDLVPVKNTRNQHNNRNNHHERSNGTARCDVAASSSCSLFRRTSCPGFADVVAVVGGAGHKEPLVTRPPVASSNNNNNNDDGDDDNEKRAPTSSSSSSRNNRRSLKRYLTADSANQLIHNRQQQQQSQSQQSPYHPQSIQLWTSSLMAEFQHIIDSELERLAKTGHDARDASDATPPLSPWAKRQMAHIDESTKWSAQQQQQQQPSAARRDETPTPITTTTTPTPTPLHLMNQSSGDSGAPSGQESNDSSTVPDDDHHVQVASPVLRPQELREFLRRVEDSIRTPTEPASHFAPPTCETGTQAGSSGDGDGDGGASCRSSTAAAKLAVQQPLLRVNASTSPDARDRDVATPTFDAGTQTSPTSLSRSSSFLWMSDCNCSGSLDGSVAVATAGSDRMRTPDSAAEIDDDDDDDDDSSVSLSRSVDGGAGVESGIGTGSPPPRDRRRRPLPDAEPTPPPPPPMPQPPGVAENGAEKSDLSETSTCSSTEDERASSSASAATATGVGAGHRSHRARASSACSNKKREKVRRRETWEKIRRRQPCKRVPSRAAAAARNLKDKTSEVVWVRRAPPASPPPPPPVPPHAVPLVVASSGSLPVMEPVLHKPPPVVVIGSPATQQRPRPRPLALSSDSSVVAETSPGVVASSSSRLAVELSAVAMAVCNASSPFLKVGGSRHLKPISATSTPTEPHITLESGLAAARSHSESAFAELEATEACRWLRATGFPQYAQMYEDWQFPLDLNVVERDHPFLDVDSLQALFRRLATLNRMAKLRSEKARTRVQGDESDEEDQECALSDQWTFQRHSRRWSRIVDLPHDDSGHQMSLSAAPANTPVDESVTDGGANKRLTDQAGNQEDPDPVILGSFRRSSSERLRHGAKSLLKRMESLRSRSRRRPALVRPADGSLVISGPQVQDASEMESRVRDLNCVDLTPPDSTSPVSSTPSPDLNRAKSDPPETSSPAGSVKMKRGFFQRRSFRPSASSQARQEKDAHSDSECSPSYGPRSNESAWSSFEQSLRWKSKKSREPVDPALFQSPDSPPTRGKLHLNFAKSLRGPGSVLSSPDDDEFRTAETPSGSFQLNQHLDTASTGTSGSHADSDYSPAATARTPAVRWHSFRRSSTCSSSTTTVSGVGQSSVAIESLSVDQFAILKKLALLRLTAMLERHTSSSKSSWGWDLPKFMRKTKSPDYRDKSMFGVPLSVTVQRTGEPLPRPVLAAMHHLRQSALDQVGVFRKSGVRSRIAKLKELCEAWAWQCAGPASAALIAGTPNPVDFGEHQPYDVADMIKQYFRELPEALMTNKLSETFVTIFQVVPVNQRLEALRCAVLLLPDEHREALQTFLAFLTDVAALASINQMTPSNLAVCLAPSLFHLPASSSSASSSSSSSSNHRSNHHNGGGSNGNGSGSSPRRRKTVGVPDQRELSQNKAAHDCLLQMITDFRTLFTVPDELFRQCRCTYFNDSVPVTLDDLRTVEFGDWQSYINGCMAALIKETKDKSRGWESMSNDLKVDLSWKKVGDGHALRLWRVSAEVEAPPGELLHRVLCERQLWDPTLSRYRTVMRLDKKADVFQYTSVSEVPHVTRDAVLLRSWRTELPRGACLVVEMSIEHHDASPSPGTVRSIVLASRYLIQPCGAGKCRLVHLSRVDIMGRSPEWYNKHYGHLSALNIARLRDSFSQHLVADGPESKV